MSYKIKVGISDFKPLVITDGNKISGFEIDLWSKISEIIKVEFEYEKHSLKEIIRLLKDKKIDIGLAGITITEEREEIIDFSHPTLDSGLLISVNKDKNKLHLVKTLKNILKEDKKIIISVIFWFAAFVIIFGNILWLAEKNIGTFSKNYLPGIFESFWLTIVSMTSVGYGDYIPITWVGRIITSIIIILGAAAFGLIISQITALTTIKKIRGQINGIKDLYNKKISTVSGSTGEDFLNKIESEVVSVSDINEAYSKLKREEIDAVVFDAPVSIYYEKNDEEHKIKIVGVIFEKQQYGIAMQRESSLRKDVNLALLNIQESGQYDLIYKKWFGNDSIMRI